MRRISLGGLAGIALGSVTAAAKAIAEQETFTTAAASPVVAT